MPQRSQRRRPILRLAALITILALCAGVFYTTGALENIAFNAYQNTSPPLVVTSDGVTLALAHSRYLTIEPIILTLTNHARVATAPAAEPTPRWSRPPRLLSLLSLLSLLMRT